MKFAKIKKGKFHSVGLAWHGYTDCGIDLVVDEWSNLVDQRQAPISQRCKNCEKIRAREFKSK